MNVTIGTFNLNNLFSRFNFEATLSQIQSGDNAMTVRYEFTDEANFRLRTFMGKLVTGKDEKSTQMIAQRIIDMNVDVLAVQEVENIDILKEFNRDYLDGLYRDIILIEGNDPRLIDIAVMSKLPLGPITSFQTAVHPSAPTRRIFGRDLVEIVILDRTRMRRLVTIYNNHLKSHFGDDDHGGVGRTTNDDRRTRQAEMVQHIVGWRMRSDGRYVIVGDMNDPPDAPSLSSMQRIDGKALVNVLEHADEKGAMAREQPGEQPKTTAWTHRYRPRGQKPEHLLYDQIWLSPALKRTLRGSYIWRRKNLSGDGSDHDPASVELAL